MQKKDSTSLNVNQMVTTTWYSVMDTQVSAGVSIKKVVKYQEQGPEDDLFVLCMVRDIIANSQGVKTQKKTTELESIRCDAWFSSECTQDSYRMCFPEEKDKQDYSRRNLEQN